MPESNPISENKRSIFHHLTAPELFVLVILLLFGSFLAFRIPLGAGFDEETHLLRVWEMSAFEWIPNARLSTQMHFPAFYWDNSYRRQAILQPVDPTFWSENAGISIESNGFVEENLTTRSVYSPLLLLPQSLMMFFLGRVLQLPALTVLFAMRLAGLLSYTLLVWLAVRFAPFGRWTWAVLVLAPMAIYQAATVSTDAVSNGIGFLFVSLCLFIAFRPQLRWKEWLILVVAFFLLFNAKVNLAILAFLPFIILPPSRFRMKGGYVLLLLAALLLAVIIGGGWNVLAYSKFYTALPGADPAAQLQYAISHPLSTIWLVISDLVVHLVQYLRGWIADYGYGYWGSPWLVYLFYLLALIGSYLANDNARPDRRIRAGMLIVFGLSFLGTLMSLYIFYNPVGGVAIQEVHGRYFSVIFPLLLLSLVGIPQPNIKLSKNNLSRLVVLASLLGIFIFSVGMYLAFYIRCGTAYYKPGLCYQPVYKNWSPDSKYFKPISDSTVLSQWFIPVCNGMQEFRVWVDSSGSDPGGQTQFILNDEDNDVVQLDVIKQNTELPRQGWFSLSLPVDWKSGGKWFSLTVKDPNQDGGQGIRLASSIRAEYIDASMSQNDVELENDMIFQYGCVSGWQALYHQISSLIKNR